MKLLICDDQAIVRDGLAMMLGMEDDIDVVAQAEDGEEAIVFTEKHKPDLILMDLNMPIMNGVEATRRIKKQWPEIPILVLTTYDADEWVFDALRAGAVGYLLKDTPKEQLVEALRGSTSGKNYVDPTIAGKLIEAASGAPQMTPAADIVEKLTKREVDVLRLIAQGLSNQDIAKKLFLSEGTVRNYVSQIFDKLDVADRTQAALVAINNGIR